MTRVLVVLSALALLLGCRTPESNPFAAFGEATIPPPTIEVPGSGGSYYTTPSGAAAGSTAPLPANSLPSISVPSGGTPAPQPSIPRPYSFGSLAPRSSTSPSFAADPADREPIRIVEAAPSEARIATAPRSAAPSVVEAAPAAREPIRAFNSGPKPYAPEPYKPAFGQPPATGFKSSGSFHTDPRVQPATYQQAVPAFVASPNMSGGQWRAR
jgi:hypothetical protein